MHRSISQDYELVLTRPRTGHPCLWRSHQPSRRPAALRRDPQHLPKGFWPALEQLLSNAAAGFASVLLYQIADQHLFLVAAIVQQIGFDKLGMKPAARFEGAIGVPNVSHAASHARSEVSACRSQNDDDSAGHVLAGVFTHPFDDRRRS